LAWISLVATALGAVIAFSGGILTEGVRSRREQARSQLEAQRQLTVNFILATDSAHGLLRNVAADQVEPSQLRDAARKAVGDAGLYASREQMLITVPSEIALAAERTFHSIIEIRDAISHGSKLNESPYREAYQTYAEAIWSLRQAARQGFGVAPLDLDEIHEVEADRLDKRQSKPRSSHS
jgi:hypothetical protein